MLLTLASASPRRHELLLAAGIPHLVQPTSVPEVRMNSESATAFVQRLALEKTLPIEPSADRLILGADTVVCVDEEVFGKPANPEDAETMLRRLSGRTHWVHTGICLRSAQGKIVDLASTEVSFLRLSEADIEEYTRSGETKDKAGAYAIQGRASRFVNRIQGCYHNVVGLPVSLVYAHLRSFGWSDAMSSTATP